MGLIRKSLAISTAGVIRPNSKKQRVAKKTLKTEKARLAVEQKTLKFLRRSES